MFAVADPRTSYSYVRDDNDPEQIVLTTAICNVRECGWRHDDVQRSRAQRKAAQHRRDHRTCLAGGEQATIFDALGATA